MSACAWRWLIVGSEAISGARGILHSHPRGIETEDVSSEDSEADDVAQLHPTPPDPL